MAVKAQFSLKNKHSFAYLIVVAAALAGLTSFFSCRTTDDNSGVKETVADDGKFSTSQMNFVGNKETGEIVATVDLSGTGLKTGERVEVQWDIVATLDPVNCSALRKTEQVTLEPLKTESSEGKQLATFRFKTDPENFINNWKPDPHGLAKADLQWLANEYKGPKMIEGCLVLPDKSRTLIAQSLPDPMAGKSLAAFGLGANDDDSALPVHIRYAERCAQAIGYVKPISCIDDGVVVPMYQDDKLQTSNPKKCDKPVYLPTGATYCNTNTRVGRLKLYKDKTFAEERVDSKAVFFCRHYEDASQKMIDNDINTQGPNYPYFDDVAIIMQDETTGKSCFFQALGDNNLFGKRVPPPYETDAEWQATITQDEVDKGAKPSKTFWLPPENVAGIHCVSCHDNDPFMHSPWIDQVRINGDELIVPSIPFADYKIIGAGFGFEKWDTSYSLETQDSSCMGCHRISTQTTCRTWMRDAYPIHDVGIAPSTKDFYIPRFRTDLAKEHPRHHWMPPPPLDQAEMPTWEKDLGDYKVSAQQIRDCCDLKMPGASRSILGYGQINSPSSKTLTQQEIDFLDKNGCKVTKLSEVVER